MYVFYVSMHLLDNMQIHMYVPCKYINGSEFVATKISPTFTIHVHAVT